MVYLLSSETKDTFSLINMHVQYYSQVCTTNSSLACIINLACSFVLFHLISSSFIFLYPVSSFLFPFLSFPFLFLRGSGLSLFLISSSSYLLSFILFPFHFIPPCTVILMYLTSSQPLGPLSTMTVQRVTCLCLVPEYLSGIFGPSSRDQTGQL